LGTGVTLAGGSATEAVFLDGATVGPGAHIRAGTILEEQASAAHSVGLKQTILMPFVTTGSLVNFCDCLMAGGTGPGDHSEVGSSYVHFNFTPHQDKATASLIGDVPRGVLLDQPPIFLGGQGGLVGPCRIEYGTVIAAGTVYRRDVTEPNRLVFGQFGHAKGRSTYVSGRYGSVSRAIANGMAYIGNIVALREWYRHVRAPFLSGTPHGELCQEGALRQLDTVLSERLKRMTQLSEKMERSLELAYEAGEDVKSGDAYQSQARFLREWPATQQRIGELDLAAVGAEARGALAAAASSATGDYIGWVQLLSEDMRDTATAWLQAVVDAVTGCWCDP
jgi:UDP-N-acetylglucosamine/UDP-N-acetylgalactosamine diphosphorylase